MGILEEVVYVEPTIRGIVLASLFHASYWNFVFNYETGLMGLVVRSLKSSPQIWKRCSANVKDHPILDMYNLREDPGMIVAMQIPTILHHGVGGLLMLAGYLYGQPWLWRHGMLVEVGGMDLLDIMQIFITKCIAPPGGFPWKYWWKTPPPHVPIIMMVAHHLVSFSVGIPVIVYFSDLPAFQFFGVIIMGAAGINNLPTLFLTVTMDLYIESLSNLILLMLSNIWMFSLFFAQRFIFFFPATYALLRHVFETDVPILIKASFVLGACGLTLFNCIFLAPLLGGLVNSIKALFVPKDQQEQETTEELMHTISTGALPVYAVASMAMRRKLMTNTFVVARLHSWRVRASNRASSTDAESPLL